MTDKPGGMGPLELHEHEAANFRLSLESLASDFVDVAEECFGLYYWLANREADTDAPWREEYSVTHFIIAAGSNLYSAALAIMRGHGSDSALYTRRAVEGAAFLLTIRDDPPSFHVWLNAADGKAEAKAYRDRFRAIVVLPRESPNPHRRFLREVFEECSELSHPTLKSFAGRIRPARKEDGAETASFRFFESTNTYQAEKAFIWTLEAHVGILRALTESYDEPLDLGSTDWAARLDTWTKKVAAVRERWEAEEAARRATDAALEKVAKAVIRKAPAE